MPNLTIDRLVTVIITVRARHIIFRFVNVGELVIVSFGMADLNNVIVRFKIIIVL